MPRKRKKDITPVYPVNFHADPVIYAQFLNVLPARVKSQKDALNEAVYMWLHLGADPQILQRLKDIRQREQLQGQAGVGGE